MKISEVAKKLNLSARTITNYYHKGYIPGAYSLPTGTIILPDNSVEIIKQRIQEPLITHDKKETSKNRELNYKLLKATEKEMNRLNNIIKELTIELGNRMSEKEELEILIEQDNFEMKSRFDNTIVECLNNKNSSLKFDFDKHYLIYGGTGAGKTVIIDNMVKVLTNTIDPHIIYFSHEHINADIKALTLTLNNMKNSKLYENKPLYIIIDNIYSAKEYEKVIKNIIETILEENNIKFILSTQDRKTCDIFQKYNNITYLNLQKHFMFTKNNNNSTYYKTQL